MPEAVRFATKPRPAADSIYGMGELEMALRRAGKGYVLGVTGAHHFNSWAKRTAVSGTASEIAEAVPASRRVRLSAGDGTKGPRLYDWAYLELADLDPEDVGAPAGLGLWTRGVLIRRKLGDGGPAFFTTWCPAGTPLEVLDRVEGRRWAAEDAFETAKTELGLAHNETPAGTHVLLVMLAFAMLAVIRHKAETRLPPTKSRRSKANAHGALVRTGNPSRCLAFNSAPDRTGDRHRLVRLAPLPSGHCPRRLPQPWHATVMLESVAKLVSGCWEGHGCSTRIQRPLKCCRPADPA